MTLQILQIKDTCTGCGACVSICPKHALSLSYDLEGFYYPHLDVDKCVNCKLCEKTCHVLSNNILNIPSKKYDAYMIKAKDGGLVKNSSSGGAFTLLANEVLNQNGVVYGARYNFDNERLEHVSTDFYPLSELRKSKYIESYMGFVCNDVANQLKVGRKVLFCGTPCQVEALQHFLIIKKIDIENLLLVRFVCHGVPSNRFFTEYKHYEEKKYGSKMTYFDFRPKTRGWRNSDWKMAFDSGKVVKGPFTHFYYYYYFQLCTMLRSSCYSCNRVYNERADITIADFWGIDKYKPNSNEQDGISMLLLHTDKARRILPLIADKAMMEEIPLHSIEYIYREVEDRFSIFIDRENIMKSVRLKGYMYVAKRTLRKKIYKNKMKYFLSNKLRPVLKCLRKK